MLWYELFDKAHEPQDNEIREFVDTPLWDDLAKYLQQSYKVHPKLFHSGCSMDKGYWRGWNVKYQKSGKSLCSLYPKQGYFTALIPIEGKSHSVEVKNKSKLLDVKKLIAQRLDTL